MASDARRNRIYFSSLDLKKHGIKEADWLRGQPGPGTQPLLEASALKAQTVLEEAWKLRSSLKGNLKAADFMADAYGSLLKQMRKDGIRVFSKRYRLSAARKTYLLLRRSWRAEQ